jgi:membrane protease YdiL (CAAX protease family)
MTAIAAKLEETPAARDRKVLWLEFSLVMACFYFRAFFSQFLPDTPSHSQSLAFSRLVSECANLAPILLIVLVADGGLEKIGFKKPFWKVDAPLTAALLAFMYFLWRAPYWFMSDGLRASLEVGGRPSVTSQAVSVGSPFVGIVFATIASCIFQELLLRGYLLGRLTELLRNKVIPILIGTLLFGGWHLYQDHIGWITTTLMGLVFCVLYLKTERLWPFVIAHTANNLYFAWQHYAYLNHLSRHL